MWPPTEVVFVPNATKSLCEWRGRSTSVRRTKFICDLARTKQKWPPTEAKCPPIAISCDWGDRSTINYPAKSFRAWRENIFLRLAWPKNYFPPTEEFLRLPDRSKNDRRLKQSVRRPYILATEVTATQLTTHRRVFAPGATAYFATGVTEEYFSADRNFFAIARPKKNWPLTEANCPPTTISCDWADCSTIDHPPRVFARQKIFATSVTEA